MKLSEKTREMAFPEMRTHFSIKQPSAIKPSKIDTARMIGTLTRRKDMLKERHVHTMDMLSRHTVAETVDDQMGQLRKLMSTAPKPAPGVVTVRIIGIQKEAKKVRKFPLSGVAIRLLISGEPVDRTDTDWMGVAVLRPAEKGETEKELSPKLPKGVEKGSVSKKKAVVKRSIKDSPIQVQVVSPAGDVLVERTVSISKAYRIEIAQEQDLEAAFIKGVIWLRAEDAALKKAEELKTLSEKALNRQLAVLDKELSDVDKAIEKNQSRICEKDALTIKGKKRNEKKTGHRY